ncbi:MAG TPA: ABC transporter ATP-binding protein, partial [Actinomycetota bacterium]
MAPPHAPPMLSARRVYKRYGRKIVLEDAELRVASGEAVALVGENGAGKTTLLQICAGMIPADAGEIAVGGRIGYCPQEPGVFELLTAEDHLVLFGRGLGLSRERSLAEGRATLEEFDYPLEEREVARDLSGGTRQKLNLALSLLGDPRLLLMDEP